MIIRTLMPMLAALVIAGCQTWTLVEAKPYTLASGYVVEPTRQWSGLKVGNTHYLTIDGPGLQQLIITTGIEPGDALFDIGAAGAATAEKFPKYQEGLSSIEIVELVENTLEAWGYSQIEKSNIRPDTLNGAPATVIDLSMSGSNGLRYQGFVYAVQHGDEMQIFMYHGTELFHYEKNANDALAIIRSITWPDVEA